MKIVIPYKPRQHQIDVHKKFKRFNVLVCHRRFGKTVLCINEILKKCLQNTLPRPRYYYIAPTYQMAKRTAWDYLKEYTSVLPDVQYHETELRCDLPNGGRIQLLGCERPDSLRGLYMDGVILDEVAQMPTRLWTEIVRPALSDREGFLIGIGTPQGHNAFFQLYDHASHQEDWYSEIFKASETGIISELELNEAKALMPPEVYEAEFECSFDSSAIGSIYARGLNKADDDNRVTKVPYDESIKVNTFWDLGMADKTAIWFVQQKGSAFHIIDYLENSGESLEFYASLLQDKKYVYDTHYLPHDANVRELGTGVSRVETAQSLGLRTSIVPKLSVQDGINAVRMILSRCWFDHEKTKDGLDALRQYRWDSNDKGDLKTKPVHDWTSHSADAFRYFAVGKNQSSEWGTNIEYPKIGII
jgi:phage terminase large subunit|tara:strand:- start:943 stop:2193 length:1251 start_codon:yes stop_codon:yes gene_type:complete